MTSNEFIEKVLVSEEAIEKALTKIAPDGNIRNIQFVVMVGGSALDFEVPDLINEALSKYNIVAGRGNVLQQFGPRAAVATGLVLGQS